MTVRGAMRSARSALSRRVRGVLRYRPKSPEYPAGVGEPVGLVRYDDRLWTVRFGHLEIGRLDGHAMRIIKTPVKALPMYPG